MSTGRTGVASATVSTSGRALDRGTRLWQAFAVASVGGLSWWYFLKHHQIVDREFLFTSGITGTIMAVLAASLSLRKRYAYQGIGRMSAWLTGHIYLGVVATFAIFLHSGFRSGGPVTAVLLGFFTFTVVSGLLGLAVARRIPPLLTAVEENPALIEDLVGIREDCLRGLHELGAGGSAEFREFVKTRLTGEVSSLGRIMRFYRKRSTLAKELPAFQKEHEPARARLKSHEHRAFHKATEYALHANKMNAELLLHRVLRGWLTFHIATSVVMLVLLSAHIFSVLFY